MDSSRFGRHTAAALEAAFRGCRRLVDLVGDVHSLLVGWAGGFAGLDLQTGLVAEGQLVSEEVAVHRSHHIRRTRPSRPNHRHRRNMISLRPISLFWRG